ncbi:aggregation-promoting factor C-terminal-like domain-containing protein [Thermomonospora amylolytica]|uniref:aggregation-promoting factor C-terminal-like domain-containing protein n=1 Tax=Thermomonospora amylolytica TaxID=1411117 RepID=UPI0018E58639|nr:lytic transglycosylase domain-containing protein [Thermomonospora amylolytica]
MRKKRAGTVLTALAVAFGPMPAADARVAEETAGRAEHHRIAQPHKAGAQTARPAARRLAAHRPAKRRPGRRQGRDHHGGRVEHNRMLGLMLIQRRWPDPRQFRCLDRLWTRESGWNHLTSNPHSGAYGIPQALPGSKMAGVGDDWETSPRTQIRWGLRYIAQRYGTPCRAWEHFRDKGWY